MTLTPWADKMISLDFVQFSDKLFAVAHVWMLFFVDICLQSSLMRVWSFSGFQ